MIIIFVFHFQVGVTKEATALRVEGLRVMHETRSFSTCVDAIVGIHIGTKSAVIGVGRSGSVGKFVRRFVITMS
jgi:hypothetical protein